MEWLMYLIEFFKIFGIITMVLLFLAVIIITLLIVILSKANIDRKERLDIKDRLAIDKSSVDN